MSVLHSELRNGVGVCIDEGGNIGASVDLRSWHHGRRSKVLVQ